MAGIQIDGKVNRGAIRLATRDGHLAVAEIDHADHLNERTQPIASTVLDHAELQARVLDGLRLRWVYLLADMR